MEVYIVEWSTLDLDESAGAPADRFEIRAFGKTEDGQSVVLRIAFYPYFFVKTPGWTPARQKLFINDCVTRFNANDAYCLPVVRKDAWGYSTAKENFVQLAFDTLKAQRTARSRLAKTMSTYEGSVDPVVRMCHVRGVSPTGWLTVSGSAKAKDRKFPNADIEVLVPFTGIGPSPRTVLPPIVLCSWDLEVYSHNGAFPTPGIPENAVIQIACAFQKLGAAEPYKKVVVCLHETSDVDGVEIVSCATEVDMYTEWVRILKDESVDILIGWVSGRAGAAYGLARTERTLTTASAEYVAIRLVVYRRPRRRPDRRFRQRGRRLVRTRPRARRSRRDQDMGAE